MTEPAGAHRNPEGGLALQRGAVEAVAWIYAAEILNDPDVFDWESMPELAEGAAEAMGDEIKTIADWCLRRAEDVARPHGYDVHALWDATQ